MTAETDVRASLEATFRTIAPIELARIFQGLGPLPAAVGTRDQTGGWDHVGASRIVQLSDGSHAHEQLMAYEPPRHFSYRLDGFTGPMRHLVSHADGAWWFSDAGRGATHARWMYVFALRAARASVVRAVIAPPLGYGCCERARNICRQLTCGRGAPPLPESRSADFGGKHGSLSGKQAPMALVTFSE